MTVLEDRGFTALLEITGWSDVSDGGDVRGQSRQVACPMPNPDRWNGKEPVASNVPSTSRLFLSECVGGELMTVDWDGMARLWQVVARCARIY